MKKAALIVILAAGTFLYGYGQADYKNSIGVRAAPSAGLTFKFFTTSNVSMEALFTTRWNGVNFTWLYERNMNAFDTERLNFYYGFGAHIGFWGTGHHPPDFPGEDTNVVLGIDGIIGLEYTFEEIPFNLSLDWKPAFNVVTETVFWVDNVGLSVRYVIN